VQRTVIHHLRDAAVALDAGKLRPGGVGDLRGQHFHRVGACRRIGDLGDMRFGDQQ